MTTLTVTTLFGKQREHEFKLNRLNELKSKSIALKTNVKKRNPSVEEEDSDQDEALNMLTKKFSRFLKKKNRDRS